MTLLELLAALAVMSIGIAVAWPLLQPRHTSPVTLGDVIRAGRDLAIRRGEPLTLEIDDRGSWRLSSAREVLETGTVQATRVRIELSPLGSCSLTGAASDALQPWNSARCAREGAS